MRRELNRLALAITSMVALAFLVPLIVATRQIAHDRAIADARQQAAAIVAALAVDADPQLLTSAVASTVAGSAGRLAVHLPGIAPVGATHVGVADVAAATENRRPVTAETTGGLAYLQPSVLSDGRAVVIEVFVPDGEMRRGVWPAWLALSALAVVLVAGSVLLADRLGSRLVRSTRELAGFSRRLGAGELGVRVTPSGPPELRDAAVAFNTMAGDLRRLLDAERELAADLSHRLRTPLTALRLDAETLDETLLRAPHDLRARDRAVTAEDFADLAASVPGVAVQRAFALANRRTHPNQKGKFQAQAGAVSVVVLPNSDDPEPQPSDADLRAICDYLDERRLITTELYLTGPRYAMIGKVQATIAIAQSADLGTVGSAASEALLQFLHPLRGGRDGRGWPFGGPIDLADLYERLLAVPDVRRVTGLAATMEAANPDSDPVLDVIGIPEGSLPWLRPERISLNVIYDSF